MPEPAFEFTLKDDFNQVYDLPDPRPYYAGLAPSDYRMPGVIARCIPKVTAQMTGTAPPRVLDFACGYGAIGACLSHGLVMGNLYAYYGAENWSASDPTQWRKQDAAWFAGQPVQNGSQICELIGVDIAANAVSYAQAMGFTHRSVVADFTDVDSTMAHATLLRDVRLVVESGGIGRIQHLVFANVFATGARPWFLMSPRPDVDWSALRELWRKYDYHAEVIAQVRYRKTLGPEETADVHRKARQYGLGDAQIFLGGYISVPLTLVRPAAEVHGLHPSARIGRTYTMEFVDADP